MMDLTEKKPVHLTPNNRKPHDFKLDLKASKIGTSQKKTKSGLIMLDTSVRYVYNCHKCKSTVEYEKQVDVRSINEQIAEQNFGCR